jgi:hypothetical protein
MYVCKCVFRFEQSVNEAKSNIRRTVTPPREYIKAALDAGKVV